MDLKPGYKQTEVGVIPEDWEVEELNNITSLITCGIAATPKYVDESRGFPFLSSSNIKGGAIRWYNFKYIAPSTHRILYANNPPRKGDVLYSRVGSIGEAAVIECDVEFSIYVSLTLIKPKWTVSSYYLMHLLNSEPYKRRANNQVYLGGGVGNLNVEVVRKYPIPIPPTKSEQEAIATALTDADALVESLEQLIAKKRNIKQGAMQELLTGRKRLPGFRGEVVPSYKQTQFGAIPNDWKFHTIGHDCSCFSGGTPSTSNPQYYGGSIPWITSGDLNSTRVKEVSGRITKDGFENSAAKMVNKGTLLLALYGATAGVSAVSEVFAAINQAVLAIVPKNWDTEYLFQFLQYRKEMFINTYTQGGQPNFSGEIVKSFCISIPPTTAEQVAIAIVLSDMDTELSTLESKLSKARQLKQAMMQELLTGRIRLV